VLDKSRHLNALKWVKDQRLHNMNFEMESKRMVDNLYSKNTSITDFSAIRRRSNEVTHDNTYK
jgi:hypothetical protein